METSSTVGNEKMAERRPREALSQEVLDELLFPSSPAPVKEFPPQSSASTSNNSLDTQAPRPTQSARFVPQETPHRIATSQTKSGGGGAPQEYKLRHNISDSSKKRPMSSDKVTNRRKPKSSSPSSRSPKLSKNLRALSHNDFTYLAEEAPAPLNEHRESHQKLLQLLLENPLLASEPVYYTSASGPRDGVADGSAAKDARSEEHLLSLICQSAGANCSVVGLLVFANPKAPEVRAHKSGLSPLQTALLNGASLDIVQLLFDLEKDKRRFAQTAVSLSLRRKDRARESCDSVKGELLPVELLLQQTNGGYTCASERDRVTWAYKLRTSSVRHYLFMSMVRMWEGSLKVLGEEYARYYSFWKYMDSLGNDNDEYGYGVHFSFPRAMLLKSDTGEQLVSGGENACRQDQDKGAEWQLLELLEDVANENKLDEIVL